MFFNLTEETDLMSLIESNADDIGPRVRAIVDAAFQRQRVSGGGEILPVTLPPGAAMPAWDGASPKSAPGAFPMYQQKGPYPQRLHWFSPNGRVMSGYDEVSGDTVFTLSCANRLGISVEQLYNRGWNMATRSKRALTWAEATS